MIEYHGNSDPYFYHSVTKLNKNTWSWQRPFQHVASMETNLTDDGIPPPSMYTGRVGQANWVRGTTAGASFLPIPSFRAYLLFLSHFNFGWAFSSLTTKKGLFAQPVLLPSKWLNIFIASLLADVGRFVRTPHARKSERIEPGRPR